MSSNFLDLIKNRRSVREYLSKGVPNKVLLRILEAGRWAPSAHNAQPWRFIIIRDSVIKQRLAEAMAVRWNQDMARNGVPKRLREGLIEESFERFGGAPVLIVACLTMIEMEKYPDEERKKKECVMAVQSVAAAIENMLLAAYIEKLASCWFCAPLFCQDVVKKILKIPKHANPQALITLGYPAEKPSPPSRKALEEIVFKDLWGHAM